MPDSSRPKDTDPGGAKSIASEPRTAALQWPRVTRRGFLYSAGAAAGLAATSLPVEAAPAADERAAAEATAASTVPISLKVNGRRYDLKVDTRLTLLDALRETLGLAGTKKGCDRGQCGACTVLVDDRRVNACLALAVMVQGTEIVTIEGLGTRGTLHPVQAAFLKHDAFQCGYCTPGQICSAVAVVGEIRAQFPSAVTKDVRLPLGEIDADEIRERMSGNICRCGAYQNIVSAVDAVLKGTT
jgi:xanthine dehydrogenase YagT iron-sulfur-binding subunit